ncbi:MAG: hypothetical protein HRU15_03885 [Planctomycetes bacterium]|nr:hypothetical protein [Planctomycetota bacterium]
MRKHLKIPPNFDTKSLMENLGKIMNQHRSGVKGVAAKSRRKHVEDVSVESNVFNEVVRDGYRGQSRSVIKTSALYAFFIICGISIGNGMAESAVGYWSDMVSEWRSQDEKKMIVANFSDSPRTRESGEDSVKSDIKTKTDLRDRDRGNITFAKMESNEDQNGSDSNSYSPLKEDKRKILREIVFENSQQISVHAGPLKDLSQYLPMTVLELHQHLLAIPAYTADDSASYGFTPEKVGKDIIHKFCRMREGRSCVQALYGLWEHSVGRIPEDQIIDAITTDLRANFSKRDIFLNAYRVCYDHCPDLARLSAKILILLEVDIDHIPQHIMRLSLLNSGDELVDEKSFMEMKVSFTDKEQILLDQFGANEEFVSGIKMSPRIEKPIQHILHGFVEYRGKRGLMTLRIQNLIKDSVFQKKGGLDKIAILSDGKLKTLMKNSLNLTGHFSSMVLDMLCHELVLERSADFGIRGQDLIYLAIHCRRIYGYTRSLPLLLYVQESGLNSYQSGTALHHDRFNAMEATFYFESFVKKAIDLKEYGYGSRVLELLSAMYDVTIKIIEDDLSQDGFKAIGSHEYMMKIARVDFLKKNRICGNVIGEYEKLLKETGVDIGHLYTLYFNIIEYLIEESRYDEIVNFVENYRSNRALVKRFGIRAVYWLIWTYEKSNDPIFKELALAYMDGMSQQEKEDHPNNINDIERFRNMLNKHERVSK